jgi:hypothetical protein
MEKDVRSFTVATNVAPVKHTCLASLVRSCLAGTSSRQPTFLFAFSSEELYSGN